MWGWPKYWEKKEVQKLQLTKLSYQKKRRVSQGGATKNKILAEAGYQPCQKQ